MILIIVRACPFFAKIAKTPGLRLQALNVRLEGLFDLRPCLAALLYGWLQKGSHCTFDSM